MRLRKIKERLNRRFLVPEASVNMNLEEFQNYISNVDKKIKVRSSIEYVLESGVMKEAVPETLGDALKVLEREEYLDEEGFSAIHERYEGMKTVKDYFDIIHKRKRSNVYYIVDEKRKAFISYVVEDLND